MSVVQKRAKKAPMLSFRATAELRAKIRRLADHYEVSQEYVMATLIEFGLEVDPALEPVWSQVVAFADAEKISTGKAVALLVERGLKSLKR